MERLAGLEPLVCEELEVRAVSGSTRQSRESAHPGARQYRTGFHGVRRATMGGEPNDRPKRHAALQFAGITSETRSSETP